MAGADGGGGLVSGPGWRWDVALSFAGAQRAYVEQVAAVLRARGVRCFYDADEQVELWGKYLAEELPGIYGEQAAAVVMFVSADYAARDWTRHERRAALTRAVRERREYVLPARFDDTPLPGLPSGMVTVDLRTRSPQQFAAIIADKLAALAIVAPESSAAAGTRAHQETEERARPALDDDGSISEGDDAIPHRSLGPQQRSTAVPPTRRHRVRPGAMLITFLGLIILAVVLVAIQAIYSPGARARHSPALTPSITTTLTDPGYEPYVASVAFSHDNAYLTTADRDGHAFLRNRAENKIIATITDPAGTRVESVAVSRNGALLAAGDRDGRVFLMNRDENKIIATIIDPGSRGAESTAFSPDGRILAVGELGGSSGHYDHTYLLTTATGTIIATLTEATGWGVGSVAFSPDGRILAVGDINRLTYLWSLSTDKVIATLTPPGKWWVPGHVRSVAFSPDGKTLAVSHNNGSTYVWKLATGKIVATLADPRSNQVASVAFSPDGATLAAGDGNGNTYLWDTASGTITATLAEPNHQGVTSVAFSPDGATLATCDSAGHIYLWNLTSRQNSANGPRHS